MPASQQALFRGDQMPGFVVIVVDDDTTAWFFAALALPLAAPDCESSVKEAVGAEFRMQKTSEKSPFIAPAQPVMWGSLPWSLDLLLEAELMGIVLIGNKVLLNNM